MESDGAVGALEVPVRIPLAAKSLYWETSQNLLPFNLSSTPALQEDLTRRPTRSPTLTTVSLATTGSLFQREHSVASLHRPTAMPQAQPELKKVPCSPSSRVSNLIAI